MIMKHYEELINLLFYNIKTTWLTEIVACLFPSWSYTECNRIFNQRISIIFKGVMLRVWKSSTINKANIVETQQRVRRVSSYSIKRSFPHKFLSTFISISGPIGAGCCRLEWSYANQCLATMGFWWGCFVGRRRGGLFVGEVGRERIIYYNVPNNVNCIIRRLGENRIVIM